MGREERKRIIQEIEKARKSKVLCYLTSDRPNVAAQIEKDAMPLFYEHLRKIEQTDRLDIFLVTGGGDVNAAFGLAQMVREFATWVGVLVPEKCQSAGTLFALGANEIIMTRTATLGPIDPSITTPLNPAVEVQPGQRALVPISVETVAGFQKLVTAEWKMEGEEALTSAFRVLAERVHPLALGDVVRSREQIQRLARHLMQNHRKDDEGITKIVTTLTQGLGSHDYLIFPSEARDLLGSQVVQRDAAIEDLIWSLYQDFAREMELGIPYNAAILAAEHRLQWTKKQPAVPAAPPQPHPAAPITQPGVPGMPPQMVMMPQMAAQMFPSSPAPAVPPFNVVLRKAIIESTVGSDVAEEETVVTPVTVPTPSGPVDGAQSAIVRFGWVHYDPR